MKFVLPHTALRLRELGFPQGKTKYLWHKTKQAKVTFKKFDIETGDEHWVMYKRNKHDISAFGDIYGYNRWVSAPTVEQVMRWKKIQDAEKELVSDFTQYFLKPLIENLEKSLIGERTMTQEKVAVAYHYVKSYENYDTTIDMLSQILAKGEETGNPVKTIYIDFAPGNPDQGKIQAFVDKKNNENEMA